MTDSLPATASSLPPSEHRSEYSTFEPEATGVHGVAAAQGKAAAKACFHRLSELEKEHYLFMLGPVYVLTGLHVDLLKQFKQDTGFDAEYGLLGIRTEWPIIAELGAWSNVIFAVAKQYKTAMLASLGSQTLVKNPPDMPEYWRLAVCTTRIADPRGVASVPATVDVVMPHSASCSYGLLVRPDRSLGIRRRPPSQQLQKESAAYFSSVFPAYFADGVSKDFNYFGDRTHGKRIGQ